MKKFLVKGLLFSTPFIIYSFIIILIDPYNYFGISSIINDKLKHEYSSKLNYAIWEVMRFKENPKENIFLGDSRMLGINTKKVKEISGFDFYDFAYGGGTLQEIISTFWYASSKIRLKNVCIGINFDLYNAYNVRDRVKGAIDIVNNPLLYLTNKNIIEAAYYCIKSTFSSETISIEKPKISKDKFWKLKLNEVGTRYFGKYQYPQHYQAQLKEISEYCEKNNIKLTFLILPVHVDLQRLIFKFGLRESYQKFINDIRSISEIYNFNFENVITSNKDNYGDPFHLNKRILTDLIINVLKQINDNEILIHYSKL